MHKCSTQHSNISYGGKFWRRWISLIDGNEGQFLWIQGERTLLKNTQIKFLTSNTNTDLTMLSGLTASEQNACMHLNV